MTQKGRDDRTSASAGEEYLSTPRQLTRRAVVAGMGLGGMVVAAGPLLRRRPPLTPASIWPGGTYSSDVTLSGRTVIPAGTVVTLDPHADVVVTLVMDNVVRLDAGLIVRGTLVSQPDAGHHHEFAITGPFQESHFMGASGSGDAVVPSDIGIWVRDGGSLSLQGSPRTRLSYLTADAPAGASALTCAVPPDWQVGDLVVIAGTSPSTTAGFDRSSETFAIGAGTTGTTLVLDGTLVHDHPGVVVDGNRHYPEVINLSSNLTVHGGGPTQRSHLHLCQPTAGRAHVLNNVEIFDMGPRSATGGFRGRYPLHFHDCGNNLAGLVVESVVVHDSGFHAFVPHMSGGITLSHCVSHHTRDVAYWWDDGDETDACTWSGCVASSCFGTPAAFQLGITDRSVIEDCVSFCQQGKATSSAFAWPGTSNRSAGFWVMTNCLAHNSTDLGMYPYLNNAVPSPPADGFVAFNCGGAGSEHGAYGNRLRFMNVAIGSCGGRPLAPSVQAALELEMVNSIALPQIYYSSCSFDASQLCPAALVIKWTAGITQAPVGFLNCSFSGFTDSAVNCINAGDGSTRFTWTDFIGCTVNGRPMTYQDVRLSAVVPGTIFRFQDDPLNPSTVVQLNSDGSHFSISPFYPYGP